MNYTILIGLGIFSFLVSYMIFKLREEKGSEHGLLQLLLLFILLTSFMLIGKGTLDNKDSCYWNINSTFANVTGNETTTTYTNDYVCITDTSNTAFLFYQTVLWLWRIFCVYVVGFYSYRLLYWLIDTLRGA